MLLMLLRVQVLLPLCLQGSLVNHNATVHRRR
jgi:hypothetical protein